MSKIDELIEELCPEGVKFVQLGEVANYVRGLTYSKTDEEEGGPIKVLRSNNITLESNTLNFEDVKTISANVKVKPTQRLHKDDVLISAASGSKAHVGKVAFIDDEIDYYFGGFMAVLRCSALILPRFLFHLLVGGTFKRYLESALDSTTINNLNSTIMNSFKIPLPPLRVQQEISEVLSTFTELEAELEAELAARRKQFHFYRNLLLLSPSEMELQHMELGDLGSVSMCKRVLKNQTTSEGEIPFFKIGTFGKEPDAYISRHLFQTLKAQYSFPKIGSVLISAAGTIGRTVRYSGEEEYFQDSNIVWIENDESKVTNGYLWHFLQTVKWETDGGTIKRLYNHRIQSTAISVPDLASQNEIVEKLDSLEAFIYSPIGSLKSELDARRKQFEYYRDKLLTFKELAA